MPAENYIEMAKEVVDGIIESVGSISSFQTREFYYTALAGWMEEAERQMKNVEFYKGLLKQCMENLPEPIRETVYVNDDSNVCDSPFYSKIPKAVGAAVNAGSS